jgi:hypothetical protein
VASISAVSDLEEPVADAVRWLVAALAGPGVRFAAGFALLDRPSGTIIWRGGSADGFTAEIVATKDAAAVILANVTPAPTLRDQAIHLIR